MKKAGAKRLLLAGIAVLATTLWLTRHYGGRMLVRTDHVLICVGAMALLGEWFPEKLPVSLLTIAGFPMTLVEEPRGYSSSTIEASPWGRLVSEEPESSHVPSAVVLTGRCQRN